MRFRPLAKDDLPLLYAWLASRHVVEAWGAPPSWEEVVAEYAPNGATSALDAENGVAFLLAADEEGPFGFVQVYRVMAHQDDGWWPDETDPCAVGIDFLVGNAGRLRQGLGTRMLRAVVARLREDPRTTKIQSDPSPDNPRSVACLRRAGFDEVGVVDTPDGPAVLMHARLT